MSNSDINGKKEYIIKETGMKSQIFVKDLLIGNLNPIKACIVYVNGLANKDMIDRDILNPLMFQLKEELTNSEGLAQYLCLKYIPMCSTIVDKNLNNAVEDLKSGKTILIIEASEEVIIIDTVAGNYRAITEPINEITIRGSREGFVENIEINISILRRRIKDKTLTVEKYKVGRRSQTDVALVYIRDIADDDILKIVREKIQAVDVDFITTTESLMRYIEDYTYTPFPLNYGTERPDIVESNIMEGRIAILTSGAASVCTVPALFTEFFQGVEDYSQRTIIVSFLRVLRVMAIFLVITFSSIYLTLIRFNAGLIPVKFVIPIVQSRVGIALTPFLEILVLEIIVELLREGGLRIPSKIAQTASVVGGIIIGDTAVRSKIVSPTTLLIVGITVVTSFIIPNYDMALAIRFLRFPMLVLANAMGIFGISLGWFFIFIHLASLDSYGVPYLSLNRSDLEDFAVISPLWKMHRRPSGIPNKDDIRRRDFRTKLRGQKNE